VGPRMARGDVMPSIIFGFPTTKGRDCDGDRYEPAAGCDATRPLEQDQRLCRDRSG